MLSCVIAFATAGACSALAFRTTPLPHPITRLRTGHQLGSCHIPTCTRLFLRIDDIEQKAQSASDAWDTFATPFVNPDEAKQIEQRLSNRADVACLRIGGRPSSVRSRFVFTNPDLGMDGALAEDQFCSVLCVQGASLLDADPWPNVLASIGVDLENVGDVVVFLDRSMTAYLAVAPDVAKVCSRLLPKELPGTGVTVTELEAGEVIPEGGEVQDMELKRIDKREQKRK